MLSQACHFNKEKFLKLFLVKKTNLISPESFKTVNMPHLEDLPFWLYQQKLVF